ncbi:MAG: hypothetical protein GTO71_11560 [Woeseiaceae bacterium]|nr:hypothetical protein [Woeseiaceae bacterium]NIP21703.1 hypothetical protein [Woeseiaceae bacterium]
MKKRLFTLAGTLALGLLTSVTFAGKEDPSTKYAPSDEGIQPVSGVLKFLRNCPAGTDAHFKNVNPFISGGSGSEGEVIWQGVFPIDGTDVTLKVTWYPANNSYEFDIPDRNGVVWAVGPEVDSDKLIYPYETPVFADGGHNVLKSGDPSATINHLDLCLSLVDTTPPGIVFVEPQHGDTVSGDSVTVTVLVTDESGLTSVILSVDDGSPDAVMSCSATNNPDEYSCTADWSTSGLDAGTYTLSVTATDGAVPNQNTFTESITVEYQFSLVDCYGDLDPSDLDPEELEGCNPTGQELKQAPFGANNPETKYIFGEVIQATDWAKLNVRDCGPDALPDPRMKYEAGRWVPDPNWIGTSPNPGELYVFGDGIGVRPANLPADAEWIIGPLHYGYEGCFGGTFHYANWTLVEAYGDPDNPPGQTNPLFFINSFFPELNWAYAGNVAPCYGEFDTQDPPEPRDDFTLNLQQSAEFLYQTADDRDEDGFPDMVELMSTPYTETCGSGRTLSRGKSFAGWNIIETTPDPDAAEEAIVQFKCDLIDQQFTNLQTVVALAKLDLAKGKVSTAERFINQAQSQAENCPQVQSLDRAYDDLGSAFDAWQKLEFFVTNPNPAGDVLGRIGNLRYRIFNAREEILRLQDEGIL